MKKNYIGVSQHFNEFWNLKLYDNGGNQTLFNMGISIDSCPIYSVKTVYKKKPLIVSFCNSLYSMDTMVNGDEIAENKPNGM